MQDRAEADQEQQQQQQPKTTSATIKTLNVMMQSVLIQQRAVVQAKAGTHNEASVRRTEGASGAALLSHPAAPPSMLALALAAHRPPTWPSLSFLVECELASFSTAPLPQCPARLAQVLLNLKRQYFALSLKQQLNRGEIEAQLIPCSPFRSFTTVALSSVARPTPISVQFANHLANLQQAHH